MKQKIAIIGGGPAGMMLGIMLNTEKYDVTIYERNPTLGRKFLVAGKGGFNLTHAQPMSSFIQQYEPAGFLKEALLFFDNKQLTQWLESVGVKTFVGSSNRVFPIEDIKPARVLKSMIEQLEANKVSIQTAMQWTGWNDQRDLLFNGDISVSSDIQVFALGGASWKVTGPDGHWLTLFKNKSVQTSPFQPSNCAVKIKWSETFLSKAEGKALKNIQITSGAKKCTGEVVITQFGMEGSPVYALSSEFRRAIKVSGYADIYLDLKPHLSSIQIAEKLAKKRTKSWTVHVQRQLKIPRTALELLYENTSKEQYTNPIYLSELIKNLPLKVLELAPLDEAISTVGGIALEACDEHFQLNKLKDTYVIGEMLDWNAPTGGYLLQACFSMGAFLAHNLN